MTGEKHCNRPLEYGGSYLSKKSGAVHPWQGELSGDYYHCTHQETKGVTTNQLARYEADHLQHT